MKIKTAFILYLNILPLFLFGHASLVFPVGGEVFMPGQTITIQWKNDILHEPVGWDLHYSLNGGATWTVIKTGLPIDQFSYIWTVPDIISSLGIIRVTQVNVQEDYYGSNTTYFKISNNPDPVVTGIHDRNEEPIFIINKIEQGIASFSIHQNVAAPIHGRIYDTKGSEVVRWNPPTKEANYVWEVSLPYSQVYIVRIDMGSNMLTRKIFISP